MAEAGKILQNRVNGCTLDSKGKIVKIHYECNYLLDCRTGEITNLYQKSKETISQAAIRREIQRAKAWRMVWDCSAT